jgi:hypothetical protein
VNGPWLSNNNSTNGEVATKLHPQDNAMQVDGEEPLLLPASQWKQVLVRKISCGGDQSFALIGPYTVEHFAIFYFIVSFFNLLIFWFRRTSSQRITESGHRKLK